MKGKIYDSIFIFNRFRVDSHTFMQTQYSKTNCLLHAFEYLFEDFKQYGFGIKMNHNHKKDEVIVSNIRKMVTTDRRNVSHFYQNKEIYDKSRNMCLPQNRTSVQPETPNPVYLQNHQRLGFCCQSNQPKMSAENSMKRLLHCILSSEYMS